MAIIICKSLLDQFSDRSVMISTCVLTALFLS